MAAHSYDVTRFNPPAPVLFIQLSSPARPSPIAVTALLDSGADITVVPRTVAQNLSLQPVYVTYSRGFGGTVQENTVFSALVSLEKEEPVIIGVLTWDEDYALLGRDVLNGWRVLLDGPGLILTVSP
jgi:predicted aspartyl protease